MCFCWWWNPSHCYHLAKFHGVWQSFQHTWQAELCCRFSPWQWPMGVLMSSLLSGLCMERISAQGGFSSLPRFAFMDSGLMWCLWWKYSLHHTQPLNCVPHCSCLCDNKVLILWAAFNLEGSDHEECFEDTVVFYQPERINVFCGNAQIFMSQRGQYDGREWFSLWFWLNLHHYLRPRQHCRALWNVSCDLDANFICGSISNWGGAGVTTSSASGSGVSLPPSSMECSAFPSTIKRKLASVH